MTTSDNVYQEISESVYWIDPNHKDYDPTYKKDAIKTFGEKKYKILRTEDNQDNGMQAMVVAPLDKNGHVDKSQVVIAYAGTNSADVNDLRADINTVVAGSEYAHLGASDGKVVPAQSITALKFANAIKGDFPDATISTTGHSLGEYLALLTAAENQWYNVGFNGADPAGILSDEALAWIKDNPGMLTNYRNVYDQININGNGTGAEVLIDTGFGELSTLQAHNMKYWTFDKDGKVIIPETFINETAIGQQMRRETLNNYFKDLLKLNDLAILFKTSGGGLSSNEKIFLENSRALAVINMSAKNFSDSTHKMKKLCQEMIDEVHTNWREGEKDLQTIAPDISYAERMSIASEKGYTKSKMVDEIVATYQNKLDEIKKQEAAFSILAKEIKQTIDNIVRLDHEMNVQIKSLGL